MKILYLISISIFLLFIGCSSTYRVSDFSSMYNFYDDFNNFAKNKTVKVTLTNDSSFNINDSAKIENDSLYSIEENNITLNKKIDTSEQKEIDYNKFGTYAVILLKDGNTYQAHDIEVRHDSIYFSYEKKISIINNISPLNKIKNISYKNHWLGIPFGFLYGEILGIGIGGWVSYTEARNMSNADLKNESDTIPIAIGIYLGQ